ncbi:MAG: helix-turn-helix domain-containing protein [Bacilli bacterium]|nr:helix-turn-helix domain-containing protein [Bacilli bacterium]
MEIEKAINELFYRLRHTIKTEISIKTNTRRKLKPINENSTIGEQIKYYRMQQDIKQTDLGLKLGFSESTIKNLENNELKLVDINLIKKVLKELNIEDKILINDEYIKFLLNNPCKQIKNIRGTLNMSRQEFANVLDVSITSVRRWENGNNHISREKYNKLKMELLQN